VSGSSARCVGEDGAVGDGVGRVPARSSLVAHLGELERIHRADMEAGWGRLVLPTALDR
jgi:hypothetical protein